MGRRSRSVPPSCYVKPCLPPPLLARTTASATTMEYLANGDLGKGWGNGQCRRRIGETAQKSSPIRRARRRRRRVRFWLSIEVGGFGAESGMRGGEMGRDILTRRSSRTTRCRLLRDSSRVERRIIWCVFGRGVSCDVCCGVLIRLSPPSSTCGLMSCKGADSDTFQTMQWSALLAVVLCPKSPHCLCWIFVWQSGADESRKERTDSP